MQGRGPVHAQRPQEHHRGSGMPRAAKHPHSSRGPVMLALFVQLAAREGREMKLGCDSKRIWREASALAHRRVWNTRALVVLLLCAVRPCLPHTTPAPQRALCPGLGDVDGLCRLLRLRGGDDISGGAGSEAADGDKDELYADGVSAPKPSVLGSVWKHLQAVAEAVPQAKTSNSSDSAGEHTAQQMARHKKKKRRRDETLDATRGQAKSHRVEDEGGGNPTAPPSTSPAKPASPTASPLKQVTSQFREKVRSAVLNSPNYKGFAEFYKAKLHEMRSQHPGATHNGLQQMISELWQEEKQHRKHGEPLPTESTHKEEQCDSRSCVDQGVPCPPCAKQNKGIAACFAQGHLYLTQKGEVPSSCKHCKARNKGALFCFKRGHMVNLRAMLGGSANETCSRAVDVDADDVDAPSAVDQAGDEAGGDENDFAEADSAGVEGDDDATRVSDYVPEAANVPAHDRGRSRGMGGGDEGADGARGGIQKNNERIPPLETFFPPRSRAAPVTAAAAASGTRTADAPAETPVLATPVTQKPSTSAPGGSSLEEGVGDGGADNAGREGVNLAPVLPLERGFPPRSLAALVNAAASASGTKMADVPAQTPVLVAPLSTPVPLSTSALAPLSPQATEGLERKGGEGDGLQGEKRIERRGRKRKPRTAEEEQMEREKAARRERRRLEREGAGLDARGRPRKVVSFSRPSSSCLILLPPPPSPSSSFFLLLLPRTPSSSSFFLLLLPPPPPLLLDEEETQDLDGV